MTFPSFYNKVQDIELYDPLSKMLGAFDDGIIKFKYIIAVKAAGHSCPTVAGAYLMLAKGLKELYPDSLPVRGEIKVEFKERMQDGVAGVIANVVSMITGATEFSGFKGIQGNFARHSLMSFGSDISSSMRLTRKDSGVSIDIYYDPSSVVADDRMIPLMNKILSKNADIKEEKLFGELWQDRVKRLLIDNFDNNKVVRITKV